MDEYYPEYFDFDEESNEFERCSLCGFEGDPLDPQPGDHADDCPRNPWGYNQPDFLKNISEN